MLTRACVQIHAAVNMQSLCCSQRSRSTGVMETLPPEIIQAISVYLQDKDIVHFALASHFTANAIVDSHLTRSRRKKAIVRLKDWTGLSDELVADLLKVRTFGELNHSKYNSSSYHCFLCAPPTSNSRFLPCRNIGAANDGYFLVCSSCQELTDFDIVSKQRAHAEYALSKKQLHDVMHKQVYDDRGRRGFWKKTLRDKAVAVYGSEEKWQNEIEKRKIRKERLKSSKANVLRQEREANGAKHYERIVKEFTGTAMALVPWNEFKRTLIPVFFELPSTSSVVKESGGSDEYAMTRVREAICALATKYEIKRLYDESGARNGKEIWFPAWPDFRERILGHSCILSDVFSNFASQPSGAEHFEIIEDVVTHELTAYRQMFKKDQNKLLLKDMLHRNGLVAEFIHDPVCKGVINDDHESYHRYFPFIFPSSLSTFSSSLIPSNKMTDEQKDVMPYIDFVVNYIKEGIWFLGNSPVYADARSSQGPYPAYGHNLLEEELRRKKAILWYLLFAPAQNSASTSKCSPLCSLSSFSQKRFSHMERLIATMTSSETISWICKLIQKYNRASTTNPKTQPPWKPCPYTTPNVACASSFLGYPQTRKPFDCRYDECQDTTSTSLFFHNNGLCDIGELIRHAVYKHDEMVEGWPPKPKDYDIPTSYDSSMGSSPAYISYDEDMTSFPRDRHRRSTDRCAFLDPRSKEPELGGSDAEACFRYGIPRYGCGTCRGYSYSTATDILNNTSSTQPHTLGSEISSQKKRNERTTKSTTTYNKRKRVTDEENSVAVTPIAISQPESPAGDHIRRSKRQKSPFSTASLTAYGSKPDQIKLFTDATAALDDSSVGSSIKICPQRTSVLDSSASDGDITDSSDGNYGLVKPVDTKQKIPVRIPSIRVGSSSSASSITLPKNRKKAQSTTYENLDWLFSERDNDTKANGVGASSSSLSSASRNIRASSSRRDDTMLTLNNNAAFAQAIFRLEEAFLHHVEEHPDIDVNIVCVLPYRKRTCSHNV